MHKMTGDVWDKKRLVLDQKSLFCIQNHRWGLGPIETSNSGVNHGVLSAQNDRLYLGPIETCYSSPKVAVLRPKTTDEGWDP